MLDFIFIAVCFVIHPILGAIAIVVACIGLAGD